MTSHITEEGDSNLIEIHCNLCDEGLAAPNSALGRSLVAAFKAEHQGDHS